MKFSVLLSVYFKESASNLNSALTSIWDTQSLKPAEIVLVKDGPLTECLEAEIKEWERLLGRVLIIITLPTNKGLAFALNKGLNYCNYDLVARMDTDDISLPNRFEKQVQFMSLHPDIAASSGVIEEFDESGRALAKRILPLEHNDLVLFAKRRSPLSHPATIFRKRAVLAVGGYPEFRNAQDYALWSLLIVRGYRLANHHDLLVMMRAGSDLINRRGFKFLKNEVDLLKYQYMYGHTDY